MNDNMTVTVLFVDPDEGWRYGFPKIVPEWLKPEDLSAWIYRQGYPRTTKDGDLHEPVYRLWYKNVSHSDLPSDYYKENASHAININDSIC